MAALELDLENPQYTYLTTKAKAEAALELLAKEKKIAVDVEASGLDPHTGLLILVQLSTDKHAYIFDDRKIRLRELPLFKQIMEDRSIIKLLHNGKFDYKYIKVHTDAALNNIYDSMLAEGVLTAGQGVKIGLKYTFERYFGQGLLNKEAQESFVGMTQNQRVTTDQLKYAARDVLILFPIFEKQTKLLAQYELMNIAKLEFATTIVVAEMELKGVFINKVKWKEIIKNLEKRKVEIASEFQEAVRPYYSVSQLDLFGNAAEAININSQQQLMDLFNNKLGLNMPSTGSQILLNYDHPVVKLLAKYRGYDKLISAFGDSIMNLINPKTKRIHPEFWQIKTATGRFACSNPNLQQIPRNTPDAPFRECFNPAPGYKLVVSDYSGFEMRILAELSADANMVKALNEGLDIHSYTAALMFDKEYTDDFKKKYPELRQMAKPIGFGLMYGMGALGLIGNIKKESGKELTPEESQDLIDKYFKAYPSVKTFLDGLGSFAVKNGFSKTPAGRRRWYKKPEKNDPDFRKKISKIEREAKNHPIQGTNADVIKYALVFVYERMKKDGIDGSIILTVHDEIVCEVREDQADAFASVLQGEMLRAGEIFIKKVKVKSEPFVGDVWEH